jgi:serine/threonine protein kinase
MAKVGVGSVIDHYKLVEELGHGGMGVVYKALNVHLDKFVAIKTIGIGLDSHENFINRFRTEARALAKLEDPNIVRIYDFRVDDEQWFIVMEYVEGGTLAGRIRGSQPIPYLSALPLMKQLLNAIGHAHHVGIIHRDIKPNNVMITRDGVVKVTDFGLAKDQHHHSNTFTGSTGGTLYYMSPEQVKGLHFTDHRSDIYAIGLTFYEMLAGKIPFRKDDTDFAIREAIIKRQFPPPSHFNPQIPVGLNGLVMRAIEKSPDARFQNVHEMMNSIIQFEKHEGVTVPATPKQAYRPEKMYDLAKINIPAAKKTSSAKPVRKKRRRVRNILAGLLAVIIPLLLWLGSKVVNVEQMINSPAQDHHITIRSNPDAVLVVANGDTLGRTPLLKAILPVGLVRFSLSRDDYIPSDTSLMVSPTKESVLLFHLTASAEIAQNQDPQENQISTIERPVYVSQNRPRPIRRSETDSPAAQTGSVEVRSNPRDAQIWINDQPITGKYTPAVIGELTAGLHLLRLEKNGFIKYETEFEITAQESLDLSAVLEPAVGEINILVKPWGSIYIDETLKKKNSNVSHREVLYAGEHKIAILHPSLGTWEKRLTLTAGKVHEVVVDFSKTVNVPIAAFDVDGKPVWADIVVDDLPTGNVTPKEITVRIGRRTIRAQKDGYELVSGAKNLMLDDHLEEPLTFILRRRL